MKKTVLHNLDVDTDGVADVYFLLLDEEANSGRLHSVQIAPDSDLAERLTAANMSIVDDLKWPQISADAWQSLEETLATIQTQDVKLAYAKLKAERENVTRI